MIIDKLHAFLFMKKTNKNSIYDISPVPFSDVEITDQFWSGRIATNRNITIPYGFRKCEEEGRIRNFARAGGMMEGEYEGEMPFDDSDVYKIIEGASYSLRTNPDVQLEDYIDKIIEKIAAAQEDDGYLCTWKTLHPDASPSYWVNPGPRWHHLSMSHELYNVGHLYESAYAHFRATGKRNLLDVAIKNADLITATFGPGKNLNPPGHQIIETGLVKLYRITQDKRYLNLARFFLDQRGNADGHSLYGIHSQDHLPVLQQKTAVGHAVRAAYMYAGMADIAAIMNDRDYLNAIDRLWQNVVENKLYITGGFGSRHGNEEFGDNYELPNLTSYNETCAAIAAVYWHHRMFLLHGDAKYIDVLERTLYNGLIAGVSLSGDCFFYPNCLESDGEFKFNHGAATRQPWFDCACCPSNMIRFLPSVPEYIYASREDSLYVNLFIASKARVSLQETAIDIEQESDYPWKGHVRISVNPVKPVKFRLNVRIPGWTAMSPLPGDLYRYVDEHQTNVVFKLNGQASDCDIQKGFAVLENTWAAGDVIEIDIPMPVHRVQADERVEDDRGKIAIVRGPMVYCVEWVDNNGTALDMVVPDDANFITEEREDLFDGVAVVKADALYSSGENRQLLAIPYYAWSHRGQGEMAVWLLRKPDI